MTAARTIIVLILALFSATLITPMSAHAADTKAELKARFKERFPQLSKLLDQGKIGETWQGYVEPVKNASDLDSAAKKLIDEENADRKKLYELIASEQGKKLSAEKVAERNAWRKFSDAKSDWYLKAKDGPWVQRKDVERLKHDGKIGEQFDGYLGAVKSEYLDDPRVSAMIAIENHVRRYNYEKQVADRSGDREGDRDVDQAKLAAEAERAGGKNIDNAKSGEYIKPKNGDWQKKK